MSTHVKNHYDFIVIGSGAGGATLAYRLAPTGKRILILERGDYLPREMDNWNSQAVFVDNNIKHLRRGSIKMIKNFILEIIIM